MQVIKRVTISEDSTTASRPLYYPSTTKVSIYINQTEAWNREIALFLQECGVDAYYGVREGYTEDKYLWVNGLPIFMVAHAASGYLKGYGIAYSLSSATETEIELNGTYIFNLIGNPHKTFIFRVFTTAYEFKWGVKFGFVISSATGRRYPGVSGSTNTSDFVSQLIILLNLTSSSRETYKMQLTDPKYDETSFYTYDVGEGIVLTPVMSNTASVTPTVFVDGQYLFPMSMESDIVMVDANVLYQTEIAVGGRKFLVGYTPTQLGLGAGLIALDDDDPLISEDDLMAEVNAYDHFRKTPESQQDQRRYSYRR